MAVALFLGTHKHSLPHMRAGDELLSTELMYNGTFNSLSPALLVALVSCLVPTEKSNVRPALLHAAPPPFSARPLQPRPCLARFQGRVLLGSMSAHPVRMCCRHVS